MSESTKNSVASMFSFLDMDSIVETIETLADLNNERELAVANSFPDEILKKLSTKKSHFSRAGHPAKKVLASLMTRNFDAATEELTASFIVDGKKVSLKLNSVLKTGTVVNGITLSEPLFVQKWLENHLQTNSVKAFLTELCFKMCVKDERTAANELLKVLSNKIFGTNFVTQYSVCSDMFGLTLAQVHPVVFLTQREVLEFCKLMGYKITNNTTVVVGGYSFEITEKEVYDNRRRSLQSVLIKTNGTMVWAPALTLFVLALAIRGEVSSKNKVAQAILLEYVWEAEAESGASSEGDRSFINYYTCVRMKMDISFRTHNGVMLGQTLVVKLAESFDIPSSFDEEAFTKWNLIPMHKGQCSYILASLAAIKMYELPVALREAVIARNKDFILSALKEYDEETALDLARTDLNILGSIKKTKTTKRVTLPYAKHAEVVNGVKSAFLPSSHDPITFGQSKGIQLNAILADQGLAMPGAAYWTTDEKFEFKVFHNDSAKYLEASEINFIFEEVVSTVKFGGTTKTSITSPEGEIAFKANEKIGVVKFKDGSVGDVLMPEDGIFMGFEMTINKFGEVSGAIQYYTLENKVKIRSVVKCLVLRCHECPIKHDLNDASLVNDVQILIPSDGIKSGDLLQQNLSIIAETLSTTVEGRELIALLNSTMGIESNDTLTFDAIFASLGLYDELVKAFNKAFRKSVWLKYRGTQEFEALQELYFVRAKSSSSKWEIASSEVFSTIKSMMPSEEITNIFLNGDFANEQTEVLVFSKDGEFTKFFQRTFALVGVVINVKPELCSVAQSTGQTSVLSSIVIALEAAGDHESAMMLTNETAGLSKWNAAVCSFQEIDASVVGNQQQVMVNGTLLNKTIVSIFDNRGALTPEMKELIAPLTALKAENNEFVVSFDELKEMFSNHSFLKNNIKKEFGNFVLDLDLVNKLSYDEGISPTEMKGMVTVLFNAIISGTSFVGVQNILTSLENSIHSMASSAKMGKKSMHGIKGVTAKAEAYYGCPVSQIWIKKSDNKRSVCALAQKMYGEDFDGRKVAFARSPIQFAAILELKLIDESHWAFNSISEFTMSVNGLANAPSGGDFDGDGYAFYKLCENSPLTLLTKEEALGFYTRRTGLAWNDIKQGSYFADHLTAKGYKEFSSLVSSKNFVLTVNEKNPEEGFLNMIVASTNLQTLFVGIFHGMSFFGSNLCSLVQKYGSTNPALQMFKNKDLSLCLMEIYEAALGGLNWELYKAMMWMFGAMSDPNSRNVFTQECLSVYTANDFSWFVERIENSDCNVAFCNEYKTVCELLLKVSSAKDGVITNNTDLECYIALSSMMFYATKGLNSFSDSNLKDLNTLFGITLFAETQIVKGEEVIKYYPSSFAPLPEYNEQISQSVLVSQFVQFCKPVLARQMKTTLVIV